eukprot:Opistho-2@23173
MATLNQLILRNKPIFKRKPLAALNGNPQRKATCTKVLIIKPKKPNSAQRKVARVRINSINYLAYIPGIGHQLQEHSVVLIRGGKTKDLPGLRYKIIRGKYDATPVLNRVHARSKYGVKR